MFISGYTICTQHNFEHVEHSKEQLVSNREATIFVNPALMYICL